MKIMAFAVLSLGLATTTAQADGTWILGALIDADQNPYVDGKDRADLLPYLAYETDRIHIGLDEISYELIDDGQWQVDVFLDPRFAPDLPETALFENLKRDDAIEAGFGVKYRFGATYIKASLQGDVSGAHDGFAGEAAVGYATEIDAIVLDAQAGLKLRDANLNNYLFGVSTDEATAQRAAFSMDDSANAFAEITLAYPLSDNVAVIGEVSFEDLGNAQNSPLVARDKRSSIILGVAYQF